MAPTPEGKVKGQVRSLLAEYQGIYTYWPVPSGYGKTNLDVLGCYRGRFFLIETKAAGKKPTLRQVEEIQAVDAAMGRTFVITGLNDPVLGELRAWLDQLTKDIPYAPTITPDPVNRRVI